MGRGVAERIGGRRTSLLANQHESIHIALSGKKPDSGMLFDLVQPKLSHSSKDEYLPAPILLERGKRFQGRLYRQGVRAASVINQREARRRPPDLHSGAGR